MKRKGEPTNLLIKDSQPKKQQTSQHLNLKSVCVISQSNEVNSSFSLSSNNDYVLIRNKTEVDVYKFDKLLGNHQTKFQLSTTKYKCSQYEVSSTLKVNEKRVYNTSSHAEKNEIMLNPTLLPRCAIKNVQFVKCQLSPSTNNQKPFLASLSSFGSIDIARYEIDEDTSQTTFESVGELCEIRKASFSLSTPYIKLNKLKEILDELTFSNFDWCPTIIGTARYIAAVTKSNEIVFYSVEASGKIVLQYNEKFEGTVSELKWIATSDGHFLIVANSKGQLVRYLVEKTDGEKVSGLMKVNEIEGNIRTPVSHMHVEQVGSATTIVCCKAHSLEIFLISKSSVKSIKKYMGLSVTGLTSVSNSKPEFLITTLNNKIFFMKLSISKNDLHIESYENVETTSDPLKFAAYGITTSKNKALVFVSLYPKVMFDHLVLKQPNVIAVNIFSKNDPHDILMKNKSLMLTNFSDCVETIKYTGSVKPTTLDTLESMTYRIALNREFLYYLKIQLIIAEAKLVNFQTRSDVWHQITQASIDWLKITIQTINGFLLITSLLSRPKLSDAARQTVQCLSKLIKNFLDDRTDKDLFKTVQKTLKHELEGLLSKCKALKGKMKELCNYCEGEIADDKLTCRENHQVSRCAITQLQTPIGIRNLCLHCNNSFADLQTLHEITGQEEQTCPFCDRFITFES